MTPRNKQPVHPSQTRNGLPSTYHGLAVRLAIVLLPLLGGCRAAQTTSATTTPASTPAAGFPRTVTDERGKILTLTAPPRRIVSLAPSNTEVLFALGAGDRVVADTESCDYPPEAKNRPHIGGITAGDLEKIETQNPDLVVTVGSINQTLITALDNAHIPTLVVNPHTIKGTYASIRLLGRAVGKDAEAEKQVSEMESRIEKVRKVTAASPRPKVLILYSINPIYTSPPDSYIHDLIGVAGGQDIVQSALPQNIISPAVVLERAPDVILCPPVYREKIKQLPGWDIVPAVKNNRFFAPTPGAALTRPVPRLANGVEELARYLHPELFSGTSGPVSGKR